ncbi:hypothetical protein DCC85_02030 [Paenibacillus sp. CAA11]|uniref:hypothetical protein n=1 Tax=Paenibacillus sp. CAA11 TaxID=1532905 RepID=UPI000D364078|nr:hypothetical protein [Paenibacillus sp. CAA11]AWB43128.1 hypothetical protein DCC85_02030 [Paenibacillus sp. CAA11]
MGPDQDQELRGLFHNAPIPEVNMTSKVMNQLHAEQRKKERFVVKYKISLMVIAGMLLTASTGFAAMNYQALHNSKGEVVYEEKQWDDSLNKNNTKDDQRRSLKSHQYSEESLKEGTAGLFYIVSNNPNHELETGYKSLGIHEAAALQNELKGQSAKIFDQVLDYKFESATLHYKPIIWVHPLTAEKEHAIAEQLRKQAEQSHKDYAMMPIEISKDHWNMVSTYKKGKSQFFLNMMKSDDKTTLYTHEEQISKREKLVIDGVDMMYTEVEVGRTITWVHNVPNSNFTITYSISTGNDVSKEKLIQMVKLFLK